MEPNSDSTQQGELLPAAVALTPTQIARDWGCSREYARRKILAGCPTDSFENARAWRLQHSPRGVGFRSKPKPGGSQGATPHEEVVVKSGGVAEKDTVGGGGSEIAPENAPPPENQASLRKDAALTSIEEALAAAIEVEREAHRMVEDAQKTAKGTGEAADDARGRLTVLIAAYSKAIDNRLSVEERIAKLRERAEVLVTADFARNLLRKAWIPLLARLRSVSKRCAPKAAAAADELLVDKIIADEIEDAIREAQAAFGVTPSKPPALPPA